MYKISIHTPIFSKDIARKPFVLRTRRTYARTAVILYAPLPIENGEGIKKYGGCAIKP